MQAPEPGREPVRAVASVRGATEPVQGTEPVQATVAGATALRAGVLERPEEGGRALRDGCHAAL